MKRIALSIAAAGAAAFAVGTVLAIALAILDLYLSGHGHPTLNRPWLDYPGWGVNLSRADVVLLAGAFVSAVGVGGLVATLMRGRS